MKFNFETQDFLDENRDILEQEYKKLKHLLGN
jgi:hypothetical protein